jgi:type III secretory pathway component EscT
MAIAVPIVGARGLPLSVRMGLALGLAFAGPRPVVLAEGQAILPVLLRQLVVGGLAALGAARVMWAALLVGGIAERLGPSGSLSRSDEGDSAPFETLFGLTSMVVFFAGGGPVRLAGAFARLGSLEHGASELASSVLDAALSAVTIAVTVAAPLIVAAVLVELVLALVARAAWPLAIDGLLAPLRALVLLLALALCFEGMIEALAFALLR